jgi:hypothetical protein
MIVCIIYSISCNTLNNNRFIVVKIFNSSPLLYLTPKISSNFYQFSTDLHHTMCNDILTAI